MHNEADGRLVPVKTKFHREAVKPGGVNRSGAQGAAEKSMSGLRSQVEAQLDAAVEPLIALLRDWRGADAAEACRWAGTVRDLGGLADRHLLTEVAMHGYDCLDAVLVDGVAIDAAEALCYADALAFARQEQCRGRDLEPYRPLLADLERLTGLVIGRAHPVRK